MVVASEGSGRAERLERQQSERVLLKWRMETVEVSVSMTLKPQFVDEACSLAPALLHGSTTEHRLVQWERRTRRRGIQRNTGENGGIDGSSFGSCNFSRCNGLERGCGADSSSANNSDGKRVPVTCHRIRPAGGRWTRTREEEMPLRLVTPRTPSRLCSSPSSRSAERIKWRTTTSTMSSRTDACRSSRKAS